MTPTTMQQMTGTQRNRAAAASRVASAGMSLSFHSTAARLNVQRGRMQIAGICRLSGMGAQRSFGNACTRRQAIEARNSGNIFSKHRNSIRGVHSRVDRGSIATG